MSTAEERLRQRIRNTFSDIGDHLNEEELRQVEDRVLALIRAYGAAQNGTKNSIYETAVDGLRDVFHSRAVVHTGQ